MNREIKFRAWYARGNKMFNVDVLAISECSWVCPDFGKHGVSLAYQSHIEVMQYTGLKDKNGKEIYEGDIVTINTRPNALEVKMINGMWIAEDCQNNSLRYPIGGLSNLMEIVGNIYEKNSIANIDNQ